MKNLQPFLRVKEKLAAYLSPSRLNRALLFLFIFLIPSQLTLHFWPSSSFIYGIRSDYLSPFISLLDLFILFALLFKPPTRALLKRLFPMVFVFLLNLIFSQNPLITLIYILRLLLYLVFILSLRPRPSRRLLSSAILIVLLFQVTLALSQVLNQGALGGTFYFLGERALNISTPNVATSSLFGITTLRAYGTFSHPNVLAGWLTAMFIIYARLRAQQSQFFVATLTLIGVLLTQSRLALFTLLFLVFPYLYIKNKKKTYFKVLFAIGIFIILLSPQLIFHSPNSLTDRLTLQSLSLRIIRAFPFFGTGLGASLSTYPLLSPSPHLTQPDHNSFTLLFSQLGLFGISALLYLRARLHLRIPRELVLLLPLFLFDHYFITSTQGLVSFLLLWRVAYVAQKSHL